MKIQYLDKHGLGTLIKLVKRGQTGVYVVKGRAIYADAAFLALTSAEKEAIATGASSITTAGIYQYTNSAWVALTTFEEGDVYDIINSFTTDNTFREGTGHLVEAGTNIVSVNTGTAAVPVLMWDLFSGILDLDKYQTKKLVNAAAIEEFDADNTDFLAHFTSVSTVNEAALTSAALVSKDFTGATAEADAEAEKAAVEYMTAVLEEDGATTLEGDCLRAFPTITDDGAGTYTVTYNWVKLGNQLTVEGVLEEHTKSHPNTPITDAEIEDLWANT